MANEGTVEVVDTSAGGGSPTTDPKKAGDGTSDPQKQPTGVTGTPPDKSGEYDRQIKGLTADLQKERKARQQYESDLKTERANLESERKRVLALAGVTPKSEKEAEEEAIKDRLEALGYPRLTKEDLEAIRALRETQSNLAETTQHYWQQHGQTMVESVVREIAKELGGQLNERQVNRIASAYAQEAEANPEFLARHSKGDKTLVAEFAKQWIEDWYEPARRKVSQQEVGRLRHVPSGKDRSIVTQGEKKIDVNDPKAVEDLLVKGFRERNGEFARR